VPCSFRIPEQALLLLYSDGLSEAMNAGSEPFGSARILATLASAPEASCTQMAELLLQKIKLFAAEVPASDDLTLLLLRRLPATVPAGSLPGHRIRIELPADTGMLALVGELVTKVALDAGLETRPVAQFALAVDEAIANIIHHAYGADASRRFLLDLEPSGLGIRAVLTDTGLPFPFEAARTRYDGQADPEQEPGGIGLFLIGQMVDECSYEPGTLEGNRLVLAKHRQVPGEGG
jgi:anti-sigma regulatory factor (Ser/Thr protein kinase)